MFTNASETVRYGLVSAPLNMMSEKVEGESKAAYFSFEPDPMYSKREGELIQQFLQAFGKMPEGDGGGDDMDDLF